MAKELTRKEKQITELYIETIKDVGKNADNWISFLKRASYNYKYKFDEQILIYAQKPDAVACAETTIWNKKLKRWVNKGAKGIALITEKEGELGLRFVFDVSDTNSNVYGRKLKLWKVEEKYTEDIIETLEDRFGTMEDKSNLPFAIISTVYNHIVDNMQDYLEELKNVTTNSKLEKLGQEELENSFLEILIYSTIAVTMSRCGLDVNEYIRKDCFKEIENFNTFETMSILGTATRDFSKEILLEISKTVINLEKQEKNKNYTFEKLKQNIYNKENEKGSVENENNLQSERELSNTRLDNRENKQESGTRKISKNEASIPKTEQERNIHNASREQQINRPLDTNTGNSEQEDSRDSRTNEEKIWDNRRVESEQSNGMGRTDEQHSSDSRTDSNKGNNIQLEEIQTEKEAENASFFDDDNYTFMVGDTIYLGLQDFTILNISNGKMTIYDNQFPLDQRTVVIKDIMQKIAENPMNDYLKDRETPEIEQKEENIFNSWLDTFIEEKGIDLGQILEVKTDKNTHYFEVGNIIENIKATTPEEQEEIKNMIIKIDFYNGDVVDYFKHLAQALAQNYEQQMEKEQEVEETKEQEYIAEKIVKKNKNIEYFDLHPEIPPEERNNFKITDDNLGVGTLKEKYQNNIEAIKVLKICEEQNRYATPEEQEILSKYVGWGGLKSAFEEQNENWSNEYAELKELLTEDEYKNARASSVTAYYTPPIVIRNIYKVLQNMGLKQANILEPACRGR